LTRGNACDGCRDNQNTEDLSHYKTQIWDYPREMAEISYLFATSTHATAAVVHMVRLTEQREIDRWMHPDDEDGEPDFSSGA
jgi:hypothetical protein